MIPASERYLAANDLLHEGNSWMVETCKQLRFSENHLDFVLLVVTAREKENAVVDRLQIDDLRRVHGPRAALATQTHLAEGTLAQDSFQCVLFLDPVESVRDEVNEDYSWEMKESAIRRGIAGSWKM